MEKKVQWSVPGCLVFENFWKKISLVLFLVLLRRKKCKLTYYMDDNWNGRVHTYPKWFQLAPERKCVSWGPWSGLNTLKNDKMLFTSGKSKNALCPTVVSVVLININIIILWKENLDYIIFCLSMVTFYLDRTLSIAYSCCFFYRTQNSF